MCIVSLELSKSILDTVQIFQLVRNYDFDTLVAPIDVKTYLSLLFFIFDKNLFLLLLFLSIVFSIVLFSSCKYFIIF